MKRLGVIGWPVAHSRSPVLQNAALAAAGLAAQWRYQLLPIPPELFEETVRALPAAGFRGVNVTLPHKEAALALAHRSGGTVSERAQSIGAANTLLFEQEGRINADNTDAPALTQALSSRGSWEGASALVLGAGGSARGAVWGLQHAGIKQLGVWNRTEQRARDLSTAAGAQHVRDLSAVAQADVVVNCTSVGMHDGDELSMLPLAPGQLAGCRLIVDFVYHPGGTPLTLAAAELGVESVDGLELLVGQGALAFELFTGQPASAQAMRVAVGLSSP